MAHVQTVLGPVDAQLDATLMHEHVCIVDREISANYPASWGSEEQRIGCPEENVAK